MFAYVDMPKIRFMQGSAHYITVFGVRRLGSYVYAYVDMPKIRSIQGSAHYNTAFGVRK